MVPTPNRVDSVEVHNTGSQAVKVTAVYDNHKDGTDIQESAEVGPAHHVIAHHRSLQPDGQQQQAQQLAAVA